MAVSSSAFKRESVSTEVAKRGVGSTFAELADCYYIWSIAQKPGESTVKRNFATQASMSDRFAVNIPHRVSNLYMYSYSILVEFEIGMLSLRSLYQLRLYELGHQWRRLGG